MLNNIGLPGLMLTLGGPVAPSFGPVMVAATLPFPPHVISLLSALTG